MISVLHFPSVSFLYAKPFYYANQQHGNHIINMHKYEYGFSDSVNIAQRLIYWLFIASTGGETRKRIFQFIESNPCNANQLASGLNLDYKTVRHHINVLSKNNMITTMGKKYNVIYFPSDFAVENKETIKAIFDKYLSGGKSND